ncbi:MAG: hypothetical protein ACI4UC_03950, partial [Alloprevotella sp.]
STTESLFLFNFQSICFVEKDYLCTFATSQSTPTVHLAPAGAVQGWVGIPQRDVCRGETLHKSRSVIDALFLVY